MTSGAISQQIKILEDHLEVPLIMKDGRRSSLAPKARAYHDVVSAGFEKLKLAQHVFLQQQSNIDVNVSCLPTLMLKWLNPKLHRFQLKQGDIALRLEATHLEPDTQLLEQMFRLTYGSAAEGSAHYRLLFKDICFPVCSPDFIRKYPQVADMQTLHEVPWIDIDWGPKYSMVPRLNDWLSAQGLPAPVHNPLSVHSLSGSALEAVAAGQGIALAQRSFVEFDLELGRLVRLFDHAIPMPEPYFVCWGQSTLDHDDAKSFLNWLLSEARLQE